MFSKIFEASPAACGRGRRAEVRGQLCLGLESRRFSSRDLHGGQNISQKLTRAQQKTCVLRPEQPLLGWPSKCRLVNLKYADSFKLQSTVRVVRKQQICKKLFTNYPSNSKKDFECCQNISINNMTDDHDTRYTGRAAHVHTKTRFEIAGWKNNMTSA